MLYKTMPGKRIWQLKAAAENGLSSAMNIHLQKSRSKLTTPSSVNEDVLVNVVGNKKKNSTYHIIDHRYWWLKKNCYLSHQSKKER